MVKGKQSTLKGQNQFDDQASPKIKTKDCPTENVEEQDLPRSIRIKGYVLFFILGKFCLLWKVESGLGTRPRK